MQCDRWDTLWPNCCLGAQLVLSPALPAIILCIRQHSKFSDFLPVPVNRCLIVVEDSWGYVFGGYVTGSIKVRATLGFRRRMYTRLTFSMLPCRSTDNPISPGAPSTPAPQPQTQLRPPAPPPHKTHATISCRCPDEIKTPLPES